MSKPTTPAYEAPTVKVTGDLHASTLLRGKDYGSPNDGDFMKGLPLTTVS